MNKTILTLGLLLIIASTGAAIELQTYFSSGIIHTVPAEAANAAMARLEEEYFFTATGMTRNIGEAEAKSVIEYGGELLFERTAEDIGDCTWYGHLNEERYEVEALNGITVIEGNEIIWGLVPHNEPIQTCRIEFDLNVVA